jgi:hypothetical protein
MNKIVRTLGMLLYYFFTVNSMCKTESICVIITYVQIMTLIENKFRKSQTQLDIF